MIPSIMRNERGSVFMTTMIAMLLMLLTGGYMYQVSDQGFYNVKQIQSRTQAKYLADAGLSYALGSLKDSWSTSASFSSTSLGLGTFSASAATSSGRTLVTGTGTIESISRTATAEVTAPGVSALDYVFASGGDMEIDSGTSSSPGTITGDIYSGGDADLDGPSTGGSLTIVGDIDSTGSITADPSVTVVGTQTPSFSETVTFPTVDFAYYQAIAVANSQYIATDQAYTTASPIPAAPAGGVIFVNGNISITGTQSTTACIVATGDITLSKAGSVYPMVTITAPTISGVTYPAVLCQGNFTFSTTGNASPDSYLTITGLVYPQGNFTFTSGNHTNLTITGSVLARGDVNVTPTAFTLLGATYNGTATPPGFDLGTVEMEVISYNS